ncbi:glycosyltransferase [Thermophagus sp. OGC60D27]|uniref:glycosyltransferase n=1 Tax=Thermophagus sp. OGC60D27 TaxID=3458415 RepID=UPI0040378958
MPFISFVIPVYNRPQEIDELLESFSHQTSKDFEIIVVEDGSSLSSQDIVDEWAKSLSVRYIFQKNAGPGPARNYGASEAVGQWLIFLDSDCLLPHDYTEKVMALIKEAAFDCFGGPDRPHEDFNATQKAIGHTMSSFLTTGGIRGGKEKADRFYPRSFNLGVKNNVFHAVNGFTTMRFGEDIDFSMRLLEAGYKTMLLSDAWIWHKRRNNFRSFFKQVFNSGVARINLETRHPGTTKMVHLLPSCFAVAYPLAIILAFFFPVFFVFLVIPPLVVFFDALITLKQLKPAILAIPAFFTQMFGYGTGYLYAWVKRKIFKEREFNAFEDSFYK